MPIFKATYVPKGVDFHSKTPDPEGSTCLRFSAPTYRGAVQRARLNEIKDELKEFELRRIERVDGGRETVIYETTKYWGKRADNEDSFFGILITPCGAPV